MLTRGGGAAAIQRVVAKVSDLPSPLDATPGERIIVRETEEVYALDSTTRMWGVIGVLKKVGGSKPEEIKAHIDAEGNPHGTTLDQVAARGASIQLDSKSGELTLEDKGNKLKTLLRLLKTGNALRIGPDTGSSGGAIWINGGQKGTLPAAIRLVGDDGNDRALLDGDGNLKLIGSAEFKGGINGPVVFNGNILALGGINGGDALSVSAKKLSLGKLTVVERGLGVGKEPGEALDVAGNFKIDGTVSSDLAPTEDRKQSLGGPKRRWKSLSAGSMTASPDVDETALLISLKPGQKAPVILVGEKLALDQDGNLGLGTTKPDSTLDVRGSGITIGKPVNDARVSIADDENGNVQLSFNRLPDDSPENDLTYSWSVIPGNGAVDAFDVRRRASKGEWLSLLRINQNGATINGDLTISGKIQTKAPLSSNAFHGAASGGKNKIVLSPTGESISYHADGTLQDGASHTLTATWKSQAKSLCGVLVDITDQGSSTSSSLLRLVLNNNPMFDFRKDGTFLGGALGSADAPWGAAYIAKSLTVGGLTISSGRIDSGDSLALGAKAVGLGNSLHFLAKDNNYVTAAAGRLAFASADSSKTALINLNDNYGIDFPMGGAKISGVGVMDLDKLTVGSVDIDSDTSEIATFASGGYRTAIFTKSLLTLACGLNIGGLSFGKFQETVELTSGRVETKFRIPAGVRIEAVVVTVVEEVHGAPFFQVGDATTADRFMSPSTKVKAGTVSVGLNHCDRGHSVQHVTAPVVITTSSPPTSGKLLVTVHYMSPGE